MSEIRRIFSIADLM